MISPQTFEGFLHKMMKQPYNIVFFILSWIFLDAENLIYNVEIAIFNKKSIQDFHSLMCGGRVRNFFLVINY